jgi:hypothetical protein
MSPEAFADVVNDGGTVCFLPSSWPFTFVITICLLTFGFYLILLSFFFIIIILK